MFLAGTYYQEVGLATNFMFVGLTFLIIGNGFFKPNILQWLVNYTQLAIKE